MVIGIDGSRAFLNEKTGTENYSYNLIKSLSLIDTENSYLIYLRGKPKIDYSSWPKNFKFVHINFHRLWTQAGLALATFESKIDVLFVPSHTLPLIRRPGLKTVMTVHDLGAEYLPFTHQIKQILYLKFITWVQLKTASHLIAVSQATKKDLISRIGIKEKDISVIYEGLNEALSEGSNVSFRDISSKYDIESQKYFLFVGTIQPRKNLERVINAFYALIQNPLYKDFKLVLVGKRGWKSDQIYSLPKRLDIEPQVKFLGRVDDKELKTLYANSRAFIFPSLFEGFGLPILEAYASGTPVITSNLSSMPEVAGDGAILVNPLNEEQITEAMSQIITNDTLRDSLINKGRIQLKKFSWQKAATQTLSVLKRVYEDK